MVDFSNIFDRHDLAVLWYSGGKDSTAALYSVRPWWHKIIVLWSNAGDEYPETIELMEKIKGIVPSFVDVRSNAPSQIAVDGWPVDMLPAPNSSHGRLMEDNGRQKMQLFFDCCFANRVAPLWRATFESKATLIIRGERHSEWRHAPLESGPAKEPALAKLGIEFLLPVVDWTRDQVFEYLEKEKAPISPGYTLSPTSLDCMTCTAWLENGGLTYLRTKYPEKYGEVTSRLRIIRDAYVREVGIVDMVLDGQTIVEPERA